jgi:gluconolactonase
MKSIPFLLCFLFVYSLANAQVLRNTGKIVVNSPELAQIIDADAKIEVLAEGFRWSEGPAWVKDGGYLLFSDVPQNKVFKWKDGEGLSVFLTPSGYTGRMPYSNEPGSNGLLINNKGELVSCEHGDRRLSAMPLQGGGKRTLSDHCKGQRFNSPNDVTQHSNGTYYFTDPPYGLPKYEKDPSRQTNVFGVYMLDTKGQTSLVIKDLTRPNGVTLSPDEKTLYVAQSDPDRPVIMAYALDGKGRPSAGRVFFDATALFKEKLPGLPDGLRTDKLGNVFSTGPGGVLIISPQGKLLGRIDTGEPTANCGWGDADGQTLYLTANNQLMRVRVKTGGK